MGPLNVPNLEKSGTMVEREEGTYRTVLDNRAALSFGLEASLETAGDADDEGSDGCGAGGR